MPAVDKTGLSLAEQAASSPPLPQEPDPNPLRAAARRALENRIADQQRIEGNPFRQLFMNEIERTVEEKNKTGLRRIFDDALKLGRSTFGDLQDSSINPFAPQSPIGEGTGLLSQAYNRMVGKAITDSHGKAQALIEGQTPGLLAVGRDFAAKGTLEGATFGLEHLPVVGERLDMALTPIMTKLEEEAMSSLSRQQAAMSSKVGQAASGISASLFNIAGVLGGGMVPFIPILKVSRVLTALPAAASIARTGAVPLRQAIQMQSPGFVADIAGFGMFGALTKERGLLTSALRTAVDDPKAFGDFEVAEDAPYWQRGLADGANRISAAIQMGAEGFLFGAVFNTLKAMKLMPTYRAAAIEGIRRSVTQDRIVTGADILALAQVTKLNTPGLRRFLSIHTADDVQSIIQLRSMEEVLESSGAALQHLADAQSVEGIVSYQSSIAAYARGVYELGVDGDAMHAVLRAINDPYEIYKDIRQGATPLGLGSISERNGIKLERQGIVTSLPDELSHVEGVNADFFDDVSHITYKVTNADGDTWDIGGTFLKQTGELITDIFVQVDGVILSTAEAVKQGFVGKLGNANMRDLGRRMVNDLADQGVIVTKVSGLRDGGVSIGGGRENQSIPAMRFQRSFDEGAMTAVEQRPVPLAHGPAEIPKGGAFGYIINGAGKSVTAEQRLNPTMPIFVRARPAITQAERNLVEEVVILGNTTKTFADWNEVLLRYGTPEEAWRRLRKNNVDVVVLERGAAGLRETVVLDPIAIKSTKGITPENIQAAPTEGLSDLELAARELINEPITVSLSKQLPDFIFEAPIKRPDGRYDVLYRKRGAPGFTKAQRKQFDKFGFFEGQHVVYSGRRFEVAGFSKKRVRLRDPATGELTRPVSGRHLLELPSSSGSVPVADALFKDYRKFITNQMSQLAKNQLGEVDIRTLAKSMDNPAKGKRDLVEAANKADVLVYGDELLSGAEVDAALQQRLGQVQMTLIEAQAAGDTKAMREALLEFQDVQRMLQEEATASFAAQGKEIDLEKAYVTFPDPIDYQNQIFGKWLEANDLQFTSPGEIEAMKLSFNRRLTQEVFEELPGDLKRRFRALQAELEEAWANVPDTLESLAHQAGFELLPVGTVKGKSQGVILRRIGQEVYDGVYKTEEAARAALQHAMRRVGTPTLSPQFDFMDIGLPVGNAGSTPGSIPTDLHFFNSQSLQEYIADIKTPPFEGLKGKPNWAILLEDKTSVPFWSEFIEPLFRGANKAANEIHTFSDRFAKHFIDLSIPERKAIGEFLAGLTSQTQYLEPAALHTLAKNAGLSPTQIKAIDGMREVFDELFVVGAERFGFTPNDYLFQYFSRMRPAHRSRLDRGNRMYDWLPEDFNLFLSKHKKTGMLADIEDDPLVVGMKYIRTMFLESHIGQPHERLSSFLNVKFGELPAHVQDNIKSLMPVNRRKLIGPEDLAMPPSIRGPISEMLLSLRGQPVGGNRFATKALRAFFEKMGVQMDEAVIDTMVSTMTLWHYGATMALRARPVVRNVIQPVTTLAGRIPMNTIGRAFNAVNDPTWFQRAIDAGAINIETRGAAFADDLAIRIIEELPPTTKGIHGALLGGAVRAAFLDGQLASASRKLIDRGLSGISNTDQFTRVWSFAAQDMHIRPLVEKFLNNKITRAQLDSTGLKFWDEPVRQKFFRIMDNDGSEAAINYLNTEAVRLSNYAYTTAAQPAWAQSPVGRLAYMYGTWGFWYKDLWMRTLRNARSPGEVAEFLASQSMVVGSLAAVGMSFGVDMTQWMAHNSLLTYGGGPAVQGLIDVREAFAQPWGYKANALAKGIGRNVLRSALPGQLFVEDIKQFLADIDEYPLRAITGFSIGRHTQDIRAWGLDIENIVDDSIPTNTNKRQLNLDGAFRRR